MQGEWVAPGIKIDGEDGSNGGEKTQGTAGYKTERQTKKAGWFWSWTVWWLLVYVWGDTRAEKMRLAMIGEDKT